MNNLHNIVNHHLIILMKFYQREYNYVPTRIIDNKIQVYNRFNMTWKDEMQENVDELERRWKSQGSPAYE